MNELETLKKELSDLLLQDTVDNNQVLLLSKKIAGFDTDTVRFSVDAGVIDRLGKELVARHETAVSELVKNSFDADASVASLYFTDVYDIGGTLVIKDDGNGMTREQLVNGFMRISSTEKIHEPTSPVYNRQRAGKKGIGRFSAQRLGDSLTIITQTSNNNFALKLTIDWNKYSIDEDLMFVTNKIEEIPKDKSIVSGTILTIGNLREWWTEPMIRRVYKYALDVVQPFPLSKKKMIDNKVEDIGFRIECFKDGERIVDENSMFYEHSLAEIEAYFDEQKNKAFWRITKSKIDGVPNSEVEIFKDEKDLNIHYTHLKGVHLKAYYYITNVNLIPKQVESYIREFLNFQGGLRLYRNGFRVLPYAEPQNDWLGLDESVRRKTILPVHGNNNFFGFIEIDGASDKFQELSSREGLLNNEAYQELVDFGYKALIAAVLRIASARGIKTTTNEKGWEKKTKDINKDFILEIADELDNFADKLEEEEPKNGNSSNNENNSSESNSEQESETKSKAHDYRNKAKQLRMLADEIDESNMVRVLAGLGIIMGEFTHEIEQYLSAFKVDAQYLVDNLEAGTELLNRAESIQRTFNSIEIYSSYFDEIISQNVNRELEPIEIREVIKPFVKTISPDATRNNIKISFEFNGVDLFTCKMHVSEWGSILFNLYSNAKKAIKRAGHNNGEILIKGGELDGKIFVEFYDNGDGVPEENRERVFDAFFTTSTAKGHNRTVKNESSGTGLGLKILRDIVTSYSGEISLENTIDGYSTMFRIELPKASQELINEYGT